MRYFISDLNGALGQRIAARLLNEGHAVNGIVDPERTEPELEHNNLKKYKGIITDRELLRLAMTDCVGVFHCPDPYTWEDAGFSMSATDRGMLKLTQIEGTRAVLETMHELHIPKAVYTSSILAAHTPDNAKEHLQAALNDHAGFVQETMRTALSLVKILRSETTLNIAIVIPGILYGPGKEGFAEDLFTRITNDQRVYIPSSTRISWTHIDDAADGHVQAMQQQQPDATYDLSGPAEELETTIERICNLAGIEVKGWTMSPNGLRALSGTMELVGSVLPLPNLYTAADAAELAGMQLTGGDAGSTALPNFNNRPLEKGLKETLEHMQQKTAEAVDA